MVYYKAIEGKFVHLRAVQLEDAEFILKIRNDKEISKILEDFYNHFISKQF